MQRWWIVLLAMGLLVIAGALLDGGLQCRPAAELDIGGRDLGFVEGFSSKQWGNDLPGPQGPETETYRWMGPAGQIHLGPVRSGQPLLLRLRLVSGRDAGAPFPPVRLTVAGQTRASFPLSPLLAEYAVVLPPEVLRGGELVVGLEVPTFRREDDPRDLGLIAERVDLEVLEGGSSGGQASWAGVRPVYALAGVAAALGALALGLSFWPAWGIGAALLVLAGAGLAWRPDAVLHAGPTVLLMLVLAVAVAGLLRLAGRRWRRWAHWLGEHAGGVLLLLFLLSLLGSFFPHIEADGVEYYAYLRSLAFDGNLYFDNELSLDVPFAHVPYALGARQTVTGYQPNFASVGPAILWAPFFGLGHLLALLGRALGMGWTLDGYSEPYVVLICFGSTLSGLVSLLLGYDLVRRLYGRGLGLLATVATFWGTSLFYYVYYKPDFAHALAACAVTVFVYQWVRTREGRTPRQWFWLGLTAGLMSTLYWIDALLVVLPAAGALWEGAVLLRARRWPELRRLALGGLLFLLAFLVAFSPQMVAWRILFGQWFTVPQEGFATPAGFAPLALLLSPLHGLLPWTPVAVVGMLGLLVLAWERRPWGAFLLAALALFFLYNATLESWHGGGIFGLRRLTNIYPLFLLGTAALLDRVRRWRSEAAVLLAGLPLFWGTMVLLRYLAYLVPHYPSELENLSLGEFLFAPTNVPLGSIPEVLSLSFFVQWGRRVLQAFRPADLLYGAILLVLFGAVSLAVWWGCRKALGAER